jgi:uncharacterized membrane protein YjdF
MPNPPAQPPRFTPGVLGALAFGLACTVAAGLYSRATGNDEFIYYVRVMAVLMAAVAFVHWRVRLSTPALWLLALWGAAHMSGGLVHVGEQAGVLYNLWLVGSENGRGIKYDQLVHAYGFGVTTLVCWQCLRPALAEKRATIGLSLLCAFAAAGLGALNEIVEFSATLIMDKTNVGGYENNSWDLVFNMLGALLAAAMIYVFNRRPCPDSK